MADDKNKRGGKIKYRPRHKRLAGKKVNNWRLFRRGEKRGALQYTRLTVISRAENDKYGSTRWNCVCECGKDTIVKGTQLRGGYKRKRKSGNPIFW